MRNKIKSGFATKETELNYLYNTVNDLHDQVDDLKSIIVDLQNKNQRLIEQLTKEY
tara:strand:- start:791 stop:958 length:168 start_codon:yes stop_codon:yes gene_type:complete